MQKKAKSPCVGVCSTGVGDSVCRGCKRFMHEVIDWNSYGEQERLAVLKRISSLARQVASPVIDITDIDQLKRALNYQHVRYDDTVDPYLWLFELLKVGASCIGDLDAYGCRIHRQYAGMTLIALREQLDRDFFTLSQVHYERYFSQLAAEQVENHV